MATKARQQYFADEHSLQKQSREFSIADEVQQKIDGIEDGAQVNVIETVKVNGTALVPDANKAVDITVPGVIDSLSSTSINDALSARQGKVLYDYIQNIGARGRFLSNWNCATGLAVTNPEEDPYIYMAGDYYSISNVATSPATNYRPDGTQYVIGQASSTVETEEVNVSDFYLYDGTNWLLLVNTARQIAVDSSLSTTSTNPVENRVITSALNSKQNTLAGGAGIDITNDAVNARAGTGLTIGSYLDYSAMQGPAPTGYHVPGYNECTTLVTVMTALGIDTSNGNCMKTYMKMPFAGYRAYSNAGVYSQGTTALYRFSNAYNASDARCLRFASDSFNMQRDRRPEGFPIRAFKDTPIIPDSNWITLYQGTGNAGIFHNRTSGLISISSDGINWITIQDKNLGATIVYNDEDTLSEANCGKYYQWGNNYGFAWTGTVTTSSTKVDASNYGPGNYYSSDTFITVNTSPSDWSSVQNDNLWGGVTGVVTQTNTILNTGVLSVNGQTGDVAVEPGITSSNDTYNNIIYLSQNDYDTLATKDPNTLYCTPGAADVDNVNTKTFYLSSTSDTTNAQDAYNWYSDGNNPLIVYNNYTYILSNITSNSLKFRGKLSIENQNSSSYTRQDELFINFSDGYVTSITTNIVSVGGSYLRLGQAYTTPYIPTLDGEPTSKKYTDEHGPNIPVYSYHGDFSSSITCDVAEGGDYRIVISGYHGGTINRDIIITVDGTQVASYTSTVIETFCYHTVVSPTGGSGSTIVIAKSSNTTFTVYDVYIEKINKQSGYITATVN